MSYTITAPTNSFVQFAETGDIISCGFQPMKDCLPMFSDDDVAFQFIVSGTEEEITSLCGAYGLRPVVGLTRDCETMALTVDDLPDIFLVDSTHVLYQWTAGFPGFEEQFADGDCFNIMITLGSASACSNCFYRIKDICWTTELSYSNNDNFAGFNYCSGGTSNAPIDGDCTQEFIAFNNLATLVIPYTASLLATYGNFPSIQVWIYDTDGTLYDPGIRTALDTYPPNEIRFDFGGTASGVIRISN